MIKDDGVSDKPLENMPRGDKMALVRFDGTAITEKGNLVKHNWFKALEFNPAKYADIVMTPAEAQALQAAQYRMSTGASIGSIMICRGAQACPRAATCPLVAIQEEIDRKGEARNVLPINRNCPIEETIFRDTLIKLAQEFDLTDEDGNFTDQRLALELAEIEVLESRMNTILSVRYQDLTEEKIVSVMEDETGTRTQYVKDIADAFKVKEKLDFRKDKIRKDLVATRYDQRKLSAQETSKFTDASSIQTNLLKELRRLQTLTLQQREEQNRPTDD